MKILSSILRKCLKCSDCSVAEEKDLRFAADLLLKIDVHDDLDGAGLEKSTWETREDSKGFTQEAVGLIYVGWV